MRLKSPSLIRQLNVLDDLVTSALYVERCVRSSSTIIAVCVTIVSDETEHGFGSEYAFNYSDNLVIINQVTQIGTSVYCLIQSVR